ncbi:MAG: PAS domain-containing protein [Gemmatimonadaceae bacterium]|nr:PAS domain-containing protein [Gemmatimonadaceae bacterium]
MTLTPPPTPRASGPSNRALTALSAIIAELASDRVLEESIPHALQTVTDVFGLPEVSLWLTDGTGLERRWWSGDPLLTQADVQGELARTPPHEVTDRFAVRVGPADRPLGAVGVRLAAGLSEQEELLIVSLANLLAPELAHAERSRMLAQEVVRRTGEIERERRFTERIIDSLPVGLYVIDREYRVKAWNRKRETGMQGVSREEAIGRPIFDILTRQSAEMLRREFDEVFTTGRIQVYQMESNATGDLRTYRITKVPMRLEDTGVTHVITIGEDLTDWREASDRFAHSEKLAAIGQLAAGVMHEINNPLATIAACAESLELRMEDLRKLGVAVPDENIEFLKIIDNEVTRCKQIVDGLLDFSRPKQVSRERVQINEVIQRTLFLLKHHVRFKRLQVHTQLDPNLGRVPQANAEQLVQVFMALLLNAMDAMNERGTVILRTRVGPTPRDGVIAEVIDSGAGIPRSELSKIFEPFYTTKGAGKGTGLGLSICYAIVQEHQGRIEVDSTVGVGSTFRLILPALDEI